MDKGKERTEKEVIIEAAIGTVKDVASMAKDEREAKYKVTEDIVYRMIEKDVERKTKTIWALIGVVLIQFLVGALAVVWFFNNVEVVDDNSITVEQQWESPDIQESENIGIRISSPKDE